MKARFAITGVLVVLITVGGNHAATPQAQTAAPKVEAKFDANAVVQRTCVGCHNDDSPTGGLSLESFNITAAHQNAEVSERMIRKLRAGMMPPPGAPRPEDITLRTLVESIERVVDQAAARNPNPGARTFQRLNRPEYERAVFDLLGLKVNSEKWLPNDQMMANFDNMADAQALSPTALESYLNAAAAISRMAIGDRNAPAIDEQYTNSQYVSQHPWDQLEGAPYGTRGGLVVDHVFPADGEYVFSLTFHGGFGVNAGENTQLEDIDVSIDGSRVALVHFDTTGSSGSVDGGGVPTQTQRVFVRAGQRKVAAAFIRRTEGPYEDLIRPHDWSFASGGSGGAGITNLPHMRDLIISGPYNPTGISETPARKKIFSCRPTVPNEERPCAREILSRLAGEAYRRPATAADLDNLMSFYDSGAKKGGFEIGVRTALEAILSSPFFLFRLEREPANVKPGQTYRISDVDLASRLSFFLWGTPPDEELQTIASQGRLSAPGELERQAKRMLADPRAEALATRFAYQWFRLQDLYKVHPDVNFSPNFDENLANAMRRETELFFYHLVRENRSILELYDADYTFVNERLARHYGFPNISGNHYRRVQYPDEKRRGILGHGSVLVLTSLANRTSPVLRGKWVMEVLMGTPPPPPPPNVPDLESTGEAKGGRLLTTRERMEIHRANPTCNACHRFMDPIGLALDNFDITARWRNRENGMTLDTRGDYYDGSRVSSLGELVAALKKRPIPLMRTFAENLMAYALGRRVEYYDQPAIRTITKEAEANNYRVSSFILGVVKSNAFQMKRAEAITTEAARPAGGQ
ncbi:MAG: DUF1592 domain-containing protein [Acidobacteria bacterium]|nr:DUF1592 domain-containing protein [Acidobacteriota bacterium]